MAWASDAELTTRVARLLVDNNYEADSVDAAIISDCRGDAQNEIIQRLRARGYTMAQINAWARQKEFNLDLGVYYVIKRMGWQRNDEQDWSEWFERIEALDDEELYESNGDHIEPGETAPGAFADLLDLEELNDDLGESF